MEAVMRAGGTYRKPGERLGPASPGRHLGSPCEGTAVTASLDLPACL